MTHATTNPIPRLLARYRDVTVPALMEALDKGNVLAVPRLTKVVLNVGLGKSRDDAKKTEFIVKNLASITGQKPVLTRAKKSISNFKIRKGMAVGATVTLRGIRMYEFLDKVIHAVLPRARDFQGLPATSFDKRGSYTMALREQTVFPEVTGEAADFLHGLEITIVTSAEDQEAAEALLRSLGLPLRSDQ